MQRCRAVWGQEEAEQPPACASFREFPSCCWQSAGQPEQLCHPAEGFGAGLGVFPKYRGYFLRLEQQQEQLVHCQ